MGWWRKWGGGPWGVVGVPHVRVGVPGVGHDARRERLGSIGEVRGVPQVGVGVSGARGNPRREELGSIGEIWGVLEGLWGSPRWRGDSKSGV